MSTAASALSTAAGSPDFWAGIATATHLAGACATVTAGGWLLTRRARFGGAGNALLAALGLSAAWCLSVAVTGGAGLLSSAVLALRNVAFLAALYRLFASDGRHASIAPVRPVVLVLGFVALLLPVARLIEVQVSGDLAHTVARSGLPFHFNVMLAMLQVVGALVLVHNLYIGASRSGRQMLRGPALALGVVWAFELNLYTVAYLWNGWPIALAALHGVVDVAFAAIIGLATIRRREALRFSPSRAVAFHSVSLLMIGAYFVAMVAVANWLADAGGDFARWLQFGFVIAATALALLVLPSRRMRGWVRVTLTKHLFQHRYDYRAEWLRFTGTIGRGDDAARPLQERAVQAVADITDSTGGLLLMPDEQGDLVLAARWQWPTVEVPAVAVAADVAGPAQPPLQREQPRARESLFGTDGFIVDLDELRARASSALPDWLRHDPRAFAAVPLVHYGRLIGVVVLARPAVARKLDWEDFDLLRVVGRQLASYLAEHAGQQALAEAARFDDFHRRIAFVMHDIKNLASQFALLARNAERHAENPAFRADMLVTLRSSADRLNALVARLSRYGANSGEAPTPIELSGVARAVSARFGERQPVSVIARDEAMVAGNRDSIEQVLVHLVQNGVDASEPGAPVFISINLDGPWCRIEIVDSGHGMSPDFVRNRLFKPFDSSKPGGFGIGAYEARELVRAMHGRIDVDSREGLGTRFVIRLPLAAADQIMKNIEQDRVA